MPENNIIREDSEKPIINMIQQMKDTTLDPETLSKDLRQQCVEVMLGEGYGVSSIAQILKRSEKTIKRDLEDIRQKNALTPDIELAKKIIGEAVMYSRIHRDQLMRLARTKDASVSERAQAEYYAHRVETEMLDKLQSLGYLPTQPQTVFHHVDSLDLKTAIDDLTGQIREVESLGCVSDEVKKDIGSVKTIVKNLEALDTKPKEQTKEDQSC